MMNKFLILLITIGLWHIPATAYEGDTYILKYNNVPVCASKKLMNWWSAHQWRQAQGYSLITPEKACNYSTTSQDFTWQDGSCHPVGQTLGNSYRCYLNKLAKDGYAIKHFNSAASTEPIGATHAWWALCDMSK